MADNQVNLLASQDTHSDRSTNSSSSAGVGLAISYGKNGFAAGITASASKGKGHANSDEVSYSNTHVSAGNVVTIDSGGDANLRGTVVSGKQVVADVGGDLNLQSLQDSSSFDGKQQNIGGSVTIGAGFSASVSYSNSKAKGDYASVTEQTGIQAGDGGFQVNVKGNTDLKGAVIASTQDAVDHNRNHLTTGTLTASDINNHSDHSDHSASGVNLSGGISVAGSKPAEKPGGTGGTDSAGGGTVNNGPNWSWQNLGKTGVNGAAAGFSSDSGSASSTTHSGISGGTLTITDEAGQQQKTGQTAKEAADSIKREVLAGADSGALSKNWDGQKLLQEQAANAQIMATFGQQASKAVGTYANQKYNELKNSDPVEAEKWSEGGAYRVAMHAVVGGLSGGVQGAMGATAASAAAPAIDQLQQQFQSALQNAGLGEDAAKVLASVAGGATATTIGAAASGGSVAGASTAFNADFNNRQQSPKEIKTLAALKAGKTTEEQQRLDDAACALIHCSYGMDPKDPTYAQKVASQNRGTDYLAEQQQLKATGLFTYGFFDKGGDSAAAVWHELNDQVKGAASGAQNLAGVVTNDFRNAQNAANPQLPPDDYPGGNGPRLGGGAAAVVTPSVICAPAVGCMLVPPVAIAGTGGVPPNWTLSQSQDGQGSSSNSATGTSNSSGGLSSGTKETTALGSTEIRAIVRETGTPYGKSGQAFNVESESELNSLFQKITVGAENASAKYDGAMKILPDGTRIGLRNSSTFGGQTIDIFPANGKPYKIHIGSK